MNLSSLPCQDLKLTQLTNGQLHWIPVVGLLEAPDSPVCPPYSQHLPLWDQRPNSLAPSSDPAWPSSPACLGPTPASPGAHPAPPHPLPRPQASTHPGNAHDLLVGQQADSHETRLEAGFLPLQEVLALQHSHVEGVGGGVVVHAHLHLAQREVLPEVVAHGGDGVQGVGRLGFPEGAVGGQVQLPAHQLQGPQLADAFKGVLDAEAAFATGGPPRAGALRIPGRHSLGRERAWEHRRAIGLVLKTCG